MFKPRNTSLFSRIVAARFNEMWHREQLHRHGRKLSGLMSHATLPCKWQLMHRKIVKAVPCFVHQCLHVVGHANRIHENEWTSAKRKIGAVTAWCFSRPALKVEQF